MTERDQQPGANHRSFVGPADQYDLIGATQFALLYAPGLRERHRLLDIGCGSLRAGRMHQLSEAGRLHRGGTEPLVDR